MNIIRQVTTANSPEITSSPSVHGNLHLLGGPKYSFRFSMTLKTQTNILVNSIFHIPANTGLLQLLILQIKWYKMRSYLNLHFYSY